MTGQVFDDCEQFDRDTLRCMKDLNGLMPQLSRRYGTEIAIAALAEHVGAAIWALRYTKRCDLAQAHKAIEHLEFAAFHD